MIKNAAISAFMCLLIAPLTQAQLKQVSTSPNNRIVLGQLANGASVAFVRAGTGDWGIEISGKAVARMTQQKPAQIEVYRGGENVSQLAAGYQSVQKEAGVVVARAKVAGGGKAAFAVEDHWKIAGDVLSLDRKVSVTGAEDERRIRFGDPPLNLTHGHLVRRGLLRARPSLRRSDVRRRHLAGRCIELPRQAFHAAGRPTLRAAVRTLVSRRALGGCHGHGATRRHHMGGDLRPRQTRDRRAHSVRSSRRARSPRRRR